MSDHQFWSLREQIAYLTRSRRRRQPEPEPPFAFDGSAYGQHVDLGRPSQSSYQERSEEIHELMTRGMIQVPLEGAVSEDIIRVNGELIRTIAYGDSPDPPVRISAELAVRIRETVEAWDQIKGAPPYWVTLLREIIEEIDNG